MKDCTLASLDLQAPPPSFGALSCHGLCSQYPAIFAIAFLSVKAHFAKLVLCVLMALLHEAIKGIQGTPKYWTRQAMKELGVVDKGLTCRSCFVPSEAKAMAPELSVWM